MSQNAEQRPLAEAIESDGLVGAINKLWDESRNIHAGQQTPGSLSSNGRDHCLQVERNIAGLVDVCEIPLSDAERALLSAAACCHDYGRSLDEDGLALFDGDHGRASSNIVTNGPEASHLDRRLRAILARLVGLHSLPASQFHQGLVNGPRSPDMPQVWGQVVVPRMALLLRLADMLDTTMDRQVALPDEQDFKDEPRYCGAVFRASAWGINIERTTIRITLHYGTPDEKIAIHRAASYIEREEFQPLVPLLESSGLPSHLHCEMEEDPFTLSAAAASRRPDALPRHDTAMQTPPLNAALDTAGQAASHPAIASLRAARLSMGVGKTLSSGEGPPRPRPASEMLSASRPSAYWLVSSLTAPAALFAMEAPLSAIARGSDFQLVRGLCRSLDHIAGSAPQSVLGTGLPQAIWDGATPWHPHFALSVLGKTAAWHTPLGRSIIENVWNERPELIERVSLQLHHYAERNPSRIGFVLDWYVRLMRREEPVEHGGGGDLPFEWQLGELIAKSGRHGLRRAFQIIEADLAREPDERAAFLEVKYNSSSTGDARPFGRARDLVVREINTPSEDGNRQMAVRVVKRLLAAEEPALHVLGLGVCLDAIEPCLDLIAEALSDTRAFTDETGEFSRRLVHETFARLSEEDQRHVEQALCGIPLEPEDHKWRGYRRLCALEAIPPELRSEDVVAEIAALRSSNPNFPEEENVPQDPRPDPWGSVEAVAMPALGLSEYADDLPTLVERVREALANASGDAVVKPRYMVESGLTQLLKERPDLRIAIAREFAGSERTLYEQAIPGVVIMVHEDDEFTGTAALDLASVLLDDPGTQARRELAHLIAQKWGTIPSDRQAEAINLLAKWSRQEPNPSPDETMQTSGPPRARGLLTAAINTPRGIIAYSLVIAAQGADDPHRRPWLPSAISWPTPPRLCGPRSCIPSLASLPTTTKPRWG